VIWITRTVSNMPRVRLFRRSLALLVVLVAAVAAASARAATWTAYDRPETNGTVTDRDVKIPMSDGVVLRADVIHPDKPGRYPVLITQTPYNKNGAVMAGGVPYLQHRGYVQVIVDVRGTGGSEGTWNSFDAREQRDGYEIVEWAAGQPWSDGNVGLIGPSYMGLNQLLTAAQHPPHLRAIFPIVPMADAYRDIVFSGGQVNVSFIPMWLGLVTGAALVPPTYALDGSPEGLASAVKALASHAVGVGGFQAHTISDAAAGGDLAYDGPFWRLRSPIEVADRINVPAFIVGGHHDLFQRGEPLLYERLKRHTTARLLIGPWTHLGGSLGAGLPRDGVPDLDHIALRWFDRYLKGMKTRISAIPKVTNYLYGDNRYEVQADWPDPRLSPTRRYLRAGGGLSTTPPTTAERSDAFVQHPLAGICTQSTSQWTAGLTEPLPCTNDDRLNEGLGVTYTSAPMTDDLHLSGPSLADVWVKTTATDAVLTVRVTDVAPDGTSTELTSGWLSASMRAVDRSRSRFVDGQLLQPWHPFTRASVLPVQPDRPMEMAVEIFPTNAMIKRGHRLRIAIGPSDFPHAVPPFERFVRGLVGRIDVLHDPAHPSFVTLPTLGGCAMGTLPSGRCARLPVPALVRSGRH
jgi:putative CocE/NonD family hydrolase